MHFAHDTRFTSAVTIMSAMFFIVFRCAEHRGTICPRSLSDRA
jgi:hypothetical protein